MDNSTVLGLIGLVATIIFGLWAIIIGVKRRYPGKIIYVKEDCIGLFHSIVKNLPQLSILYEDTPISKQAVLLKGFLANTGSKDITPEMVLEKLTAVLPKNFKWIQGEVVASSPRVNASCHIIDERNLVFELGLFRCDEYIRSPSEEYSRFEKLAKQLISVPKSEIDKRDVEYQRANKTAKKRKHA